MTTTIVSDSFTRTSSTTLGTADTGQVWTAAMGTWGTNGTQALLETSAGENSAVIDSGKSDCTVSVNIYNPSQSNSPRLVWRSSNSSNQFITDLGTGNYHAYRYQNGSYTQVASSTKVPATGDLVQVVLSGSTHTISVNGTQIMQFTDTFNQTATKHGIGAPNTGAQFDNFLVTVPSSGTANTITLSDSITTSDTIALVRNRNLSFSDSVAMSDTLSLVRTLHVAFSDSITSSDTIANAVGHALTFSDSVTSFDSLTTSQAHAYELSFSDSVTTSDADNKAASESLRDAITATDAMAQVRQYFRNVADSVATSDSVTKQMARALAFSDGVMVTDALNAQKVTVYSINLSDSVSVTDAITSLNRILSIALTDSISTSDSVTMTGGKILNPIRGSIQLLASLDNKITLLASLDNKIELLAGVAPVAQTGQNFTLEQFSSDTLTFTYGGDLSGCTLEWIMQYNVNSASALIKKTSADGISITSTSSSSSTFTVSITNTDMSNIGQGAYYHQASVVDALSESNPISKGTVTVSAASNN